MLIFYGEQNMSYKKIDSIRHMMQLALEEDRDRCAFKYRSKGKKITEVSFGEFYDETQYLGAGLCSLGLEEGHIACVGRNSYRWIVAYISRLQSKGVFVPIDKDLPENDLINLLKVSDSTGVFYHSDVEEILMRNSAKLSDIKYFICIDKEIDDGRFISYEKVIEAGKTVGKEVFEASVNEDKDALKLLVFTSGTTGMSKGVMLSENNLISQVNYGLEVCHVLNVGLSVLPLCHTYEAVVDVLSSIHCRSTMCINTSLKQVLADFKLYKPDYIIIVPLFAELFINNINRGIAKQGKEKKFRFGIRLTRFLRKFGIDIRRKVFADVLNEFGGNLKLIICGGAAIRKEVGEFFDDLGITLIGGYGITECSPLVSVNTFEDNSFGSVGHRLPCVEWKIDDPDSDGEGEILIKGDNVMLGYYKEPEKTEDAFADGWFRTGDFGRITADDKLIITGRKKNLIVLNNGKNIFPEEIENLIMGIPYITEVIVKSKRNSVGDETGLIAEIFCDERQDMTEAEILNDINATLSHLPSYKHIIELQLRDEPFRKTTSRKIIRA